MERLVSEASSSGRPWVDSVRVPVKGFPHRERVIPPCLRLILHRSTVRSSPKGVVDIVTSPEQKSGEANGSVELLQHGTPAAAFGTSLVVERQDEKRVTTFRFPAALLGDEQSVSVSGTFTGWVDPIKLIKSTETGDWMRSIAIAPGLHEYKYKVDNTWRTSPCEPITEDSQGCFNNVRHVEDTATFCWRSAWGGTEVYVTGDFTGWAELLPLQRHPATGDFTLSCSLQAGKYAYQFLVYFDGKEEPQWMTSPDCPIKEDAAGYICNELAVGPAPAFYIFYATGWRQPVMYVRWIGEDGLPESSQEWEEHQMYSTPSRASPHGGAWKQAVVPLLPNRTGTPKLEFYITNGAGQGPGLKVDRPRGRESYVCEHPGGYKLEQGRLFPFPLAMSAPIMVVSDLDGTMVGDTAWADEATREFSAYWEHNAALCGGVLVYNTGRSLGQFTKLLEEKSGTLAVPNALITAVGTKIFLLENNGRDRSTASGSQWKEDRHWAGRLDKGWNLAEVKRVAGQVVDRLRSDNACYWLDQGTEHPHRIALSVRQDKVAEVTKHLEKGFDSAHLEVRIIVSGTSDWRYVDCVSNQGGKLEALEYVRQLFNIPQDRCVAAGDSGNDILMFQGENPAIIVGNAQPELLDWLVRQPQDSRKVLSHAHIARGILEGLARLGLF